MVLRLLILVLTLANLGYYGWQEGWMDGFARPRSTGDREPRRIDAQVTPEVMRLWNASAVMSESPAVAAPAPLPVSGAPVPTSPSAKVASTSAVSGFTASAASAPRSQAIDAASSPSRASEAPSSATAATAATTVPLASASSIASSGPAAAASGTALPTVAMASAPASPAAICVQSGPYPPKEASTAEAVLKKSLPAGAWSSVSEEHAGNWMLYMGRFVDVDARQRKEGELRRRNAPFEVVSAPAEYANGLSLGKFASRADADKGQADLNRIGVRTARIVVLVPPMTTRSFRIDKADSALVDKARSLGLPMPFSTCSPPAGSAG